MLSKLHAAFLVTLFAGSLLPAADDPAAVERTLVLGRAELELARGEGFYLVLDAERKTLDLMHRGALLRQWNLPSIEIGHPRSMFVHEPPPDGWDLHVWSGAHLAPHREVERNVVIAPKTQASELEVEATEAVVIPPKPEELFPAPDRWRLRFAGGLALEVVTSSFDPGMGERLTDAMAALRLVARDEIRIRLRMTADEAGALYRALPEDAALLLRL